MNNNSQLQEIFKYSLNQIDASIDTEIQFDVPRNKEHGDLSTNIAMKLSKTLKKNPVDIAKNIVENLDYDKKFIENVSIIGGFINIKFSQTHYINALAEMRLLQENYGRTNINAGKSINIEYVSANPTGLLHLGHGRNAAIGDTLANLYDWTGWQVTREYYFNNAGNQMNNLTNSIYARYMQSLENLDFPFPEDGYHGEYVKKIAEELINIHKNALIDGSKDALAIIKKFGEEWCFAKIKHTLSRMKIHQDVFYNEDSLYKDGKIDAVLNELEVKGLSYKKDDATWLAFSQLGLENDRVIVKSTGEPTYRLPDIAYHKEKLLRGYDSVVDLFGADHIATVPDVLAGVKAIGLDSDKIKVIIHQFVTLTENGEQVKMSKRTGKSYTLDELLDDVGEDVVRFFLIMRGVNTHLEFDLAVAREQSDKNPVFYLQYAHARICSIFEKLNNININIDINRIDVDLSLLIEQPEINLIKQLMLFPELLQVASAKNEPHIVCEYLREVAAAFHVFYHDCRIIGTEEKLMQARLVLSNITKTVLHNGLTILGATAPEKM